MALNKAAILAFSFFSTILLCHSYEDKSMLQSATKRTVTETERVIFYLTRIPPKVSTIQESRALEDCTTLIGDSSDLMSTLNAKLSSKRTPWSRRDANYFRTWATAVVTNHRICLQSLDEAGMDISKLYFTNNLMSSLYMSTGVLASIKNVPVLTDTNDDDTPQDFTTWLWGSRKKNVMDGFIEFAKKNPTLKGTVPRSPAMVMTVAQDGTGAFVNIKDAISAAPNNSRQGIIIYIKGGIYEENIEIPRSKTNLMLMGEGMDVSVITGSRSVAQNWTTFRSATLGVDGHGFMMRDLTVENTANNKQAVALRVGAAESSFYRCSFKGYQDTLALFTFNQFFRECDIYGTVDFIFGNSAAVLQKCNIYVRKPAQGKKRVCVTAYARDSEEEKGGLVIQNCNITATPEGVLPENVKVYLGRPWRKYARTVFMESYMSAIVDPTGWKEWNDHSALKTVYYGEYKNTGPGATTRRRVKWPGFHVMDRSDAMQFTVKRFLEGPDWLPATAVPFDSYLTS